MPLRVLAWLVAFSSWSCLAEAANRPNVLFLLADDMRADSLGAAGNSEVKTPHLDSLIRGGTLLRNAYCMGGYSAAVCLPSRQMIATGRSWFHVRGLNAEAPSLPRSFNDAGYATYHYGKKGNVAAIFNSLYETNKYLDDTADRTGGYPGRTIADDAVAFIKDHTKQKDAPPLCMYLAFANPHDPRGINDEYRRRYDPATVHLPKNFLPFHPFNNGELRVRDEQLARWPRPEQEIRRQISDYYAVITYLDEQIGRIITALRETGQLENTVIVFSADQGIALGSHGLLGKQNLYEHSMRAPLIVSGPGVPKGKTSDAFVYLMDIYPTLCELCGVLIPSDLDGRSFVPALKESKPGRAAIFLAYQDKQRAVREGDWKLLRYPRIDKTQLFNLADDPDEMHDLAGESSQRERVNRMLKLMAAQQKQFGDTSPLTAEKIEPAEVTLDDFRVPLEPPKKGKKNNS